MLRTLGASGSTTPPDLKHQIDEDKKIFGSSRDTSEDKHPVSSGRRRKFTLADTRPLDPLVLKIETVVRFASKHPSSVKPLRTSDQDQKHQRPEPPELGLLLQGQGPVLSPGLLAVNQGVKHLDSAVVHQQLML